MGRFADGKFEGSVSKENNQREQEKEFKKDYYWKLHVSLLDFVDLIKDQPSLKAKLKTKILDTANEVRQELNKK